MRAIANGEFGNMVSYQPPDVSLVSLAHACDESHRVPTHDDTVATARELGICLGD
jgi:hypothetical protein